MKWVRMRHWASVAFRLMEPVLRESESGQLRPHSGPPASRKADQKNRLVRGTSSNIPGPSISRIGVASEGYLSCETHRFKEWAKSKEGMKKRTGHLGGSRRMETHRDEEGQACDPAELNCKRAHPVRSL